MLKYPLRALALLPLLLAACGGDSTGPGSNATIVIHNASSTKIMAVEYAKCSDDEWGPDRLPGGEVIAPAGERNWFAPQLLGAGILGSKKSFTGAGEPTLLGPIALQQFGYAEIEKPYGAVTGHQHIARP